MQRSLRLGAELFRQSRFICYAAKCYDSGSQSDCERVATQLFATPLNSNHSTALVLQIVH